MVSRSGDNEDDSKAKGSGVDVDITPEPEEEESEEEEEESEEEESEEDSDDEDEDESDDEDEEESEEESKEESKEESEDDDDDEEEKEEANENLVDLSELNLEDIISKREDLRKSQQSTVDRAVDRAMKKRDQEEQDRRDGARKQREEEEFQDYADEGDWETLGKKVWDKRAEAKKESDDTQKWANDFRAATETQYRDEFKELGEDTIEQVLEELRDEPTTSIGPRLAEIRYERKTSKLISEKVAEELEAHGVESKAKKRSKKVKEGKAASESVSGSKKSKAGRIEKDDGKWLDEYNGGETAFEELPEKIQKMLSS